MYAVFAMRKMELNNRINAIQLKLMEFSQKLTDLAMLGANTQDGIVTPDELVNSPASIFMDQMAMSNGAIGMAMPMAQQKMQFYMMNQAALMQQGIVNQTPVNYNFVFNAIFKQELENQGRRIAKRIAAEETKIQNQKIRLETQLKAAERELEHVEKAEDDGIKRSAPRYTA